MSQRHTRSRAEHKQLHFNRLQQAATCCVCGDAATISNCCVCNKGHFAHRECIAMPSDLHRASSPSVYDLVDTELAGYPTASTLEALPVAAELEALLVQVKSLTVATEKPDPTGSDSDDLVAALDSDDECADDREATVVEKVKKKTARKSTRTTAIVGGNNTKSPGYFRLTRSRTASPSRSAASKSTPTGGKKASKASNGRTPSPTKSPTKTTGRKRRKDEPEAAGSDAVSPRVAQRRKATSADPPFPSPKKRARTASRVPEQPKSPSPSSSRASVSRAERASRRAARKE